MSSLTCICAGWQVKRLHSLDLNQLQFVGEALTTLRNEVEGKVCLVDPFALLCCVYQPDEALVTGLAWKTSCSAM